MMRLKKIYHDLEKTKNELHKCFKQLEYMQKKEMVVKMKKNKLELAALKWKLADTNEQIDLITTNINLLISGIANNCMDHDVN